MKTIPLKYIPPRSPTHFTLTFILAHRVFSFPEWALTLIVVLLSLLWAGWIYWWWGGEEIKDPPFDK